MRGLLGSSLLPDNNKTRILVPSQGSVFCFTLVFHHDSEKWGHSLGCVSCSKRFQEHGNEKKRGGGGGNPLKPGVSPFLRNVKGNPLGNGL